MIHEVDEVLKGLIGGGALAGSGIDVSFEAPTRDWAARRNAPAVNTYLYDIREDVSRRQRGHMPVRDERDIVVRRRQPPRWFRLSYLVTAWTKQPQDEHRLLSAVLATLLPHELLPADELPGALGALGLTLPLSVAGLHTESRSLAEVWSALGGEMKPSLDLVVTVPFPAFPEYDAGPPVTEGAAIRVRGMDGSLEGSEERAHRPGQLASAPTSGEPQGRRPTSAPGTSTSTSTSTGERQR
ncbi:DUF4255 domain-containing protein [Streptomyces europaeiscabiei]|uniref:DUF4255 domain-containing protein n=1 Tax=Streptomyces europaeiscabiei TaxID=146819 RepID=A0ABU4NUB2_9ACTN|nr:DUF4255 domain-containing protein [Streptomyces europaeiscabiei]MDX2765773.1 DUF4255 domain-containing protein [Streptomyces europaeiscabiei]MDX3550011.1 DUF4255 domain-containing protein [Streptomyces europaeiscabiei]MDX3557418.1 DUF4255 domain-containing protein [Streptomyces europaeiscabiei]MDX3705125.1 DUF4255 domain-containing protein [Streptomyces europaeiscabiei]MDX3715655.1 DUF4255 domain-containing protein [Streptomyces europaeiscabiei]